MAESRAEWRRAEWRRADPPGTVSARIRSGSSGCAVPGRTGTGRDAAGSALEPFSGVEIHMEMDMDWKWMEMGHNL